MKPQHLKDYNREWMRNWRARQASSRLLEKGKCPHCTMLLESPYHLPEQSMRTFGNVCRYWNDKQYVHAEIVIYTVSPLDRENGGN